MSEYNRMIRGFKWLDPYLQARRLRGPFSLVAAFSLNKQLQHRQFTFRRSLFLSIDLSCI
jgi:hypothetical protein